MPNLIERLDAPQVKWTSYHEDRWHRQPLPPERKYVLVKVAARQDHHMGLPVTVAVGYMKFGAGDPHSPYFVVPGVGGPVVAWSDSLPANFRWPTETQHSDTAAIDQERGDLGRDGGDA